MRWLRFHAVGAAGMAVHLGSLFVLTKSFGLHYLLATALAVEAAVLHNFLWHCRWTWRDRPTKGSASLLQRLARFHAANGIVSIAGNLALMRLFAGLLDFPPVVAGLLSIIPTAVANYFLSDRWVFRSADRALTTDSAIACER
jgi:putative flippase GtrA